MALEEGDLVSCVVDRIIATVVFVKLTIDGKEVEGSIVTSEIAPGRIRNLRDYVVPKKKIVCKVLRISSQGNIELSLRRVSQKERKEILEQENLEKKYINVIKSVLESDSEKIIKEISRKENIVEFFDEEDNVKGLEKLIGKEKTEKIVEILSSQKNKKKKIKKEIHLTTTNQEGLLLIKRILQEFNDFEVKYISAGKYSIEAESSDAKNADKKMNEKINLAEKEAKKLGIDFSIKEK